MLKLLWGNFRCFWNRLKLVLDFFYELLKNRTIRKKICYFYDGIFHIQNCCCQRVGVASVTCITLQPFYNVLYRNSHKWWHIWVLHWVIEIFFSLKKHFYLCRWGTSLSTRGAKISVKFVQVMQQVHSSAITNSTTHRPLLISLSSSSPLKLLTGALS